MNANEIADKLQTIQLMGYHDASIALTLAPIKLRQQQADYDELKSLCQKVHLMLEESEAEIEALKLGDIQWSHAFDMAKIEIADLKAEIEALKAHPVKELHLALQKTEDGELVAVTYTDDEHRIVKVLWEKPPVKKLTDEEIWQEYKNSFRTADARTDIIDFARAILRKAQEK